jgi:hypothetical protein
MSTLRLLNLQCILNDESDFDEIFLKVNGKKVWPEGSKYHSVDNDSITEIKLELEVKAGESVVIELWDYDLLSKNDHLGDFVMVMGNYSGGPYQAQLRRKEDRSSASYILHWQFDE